MSPVTPTHVARLDHDRSKRTGQPEVVYAESKTPEQVRDILQDLLETDAAPVLATRASASHAQACHLLARYDPDARLLVARSRELEAKPGSIVVACAGTSDLPVAQEALGTLQAFGYRPQLVVDIGVAGVHRLMKVLPTLRAARVCIVVAGMEGALPTAVAGLVSAPVLAVPTSVGYGAAFDGLAALLGMMTSCAPGIAVTNIDNGFGAALVADRILRQDLSGNGRNDG